MTLGVIIRKVTGKFWGDFLQENSFKPLGMTTARVISEASIIPNRSSGYILYDGRLINQQWVSPTLNRTADGSLYMSVLDLAKWDAALYGETILKRTSLDQMWTPVKLNNGTTAPYGFGLSVMEANGHRLLEHEGAWQGFNANIARYVNDQLTVIVLANLKSVWPDDLACCRRCFAGRRSAALHGDRQQRAEGDSDGERPDERFCRG